MTEQKTLFRRAFDALIEGRSRQAERIVSDYMRKHPEHRRPG
jgi:hypothetical protein